MFKGDNVTLRPTSPDDVATQREFFQQPELAGLDCHCPHDYSKLDINVLFDLAGEKPDRAGFAIEVDDTYIGYCALMKVQSPRGNFELGINIGSAEHWNQGYGREAVSLLLNYGFHYLPGRRIELTTHERNERAIACYLACGFAEEGRLRKAIWIEGEYIDLVLMAILREEWHGLD